ncbi:hypothetical protein GCM10009630_35510 [Kribbella jejuensis]|uniref:Uncharacterized protein n=1 Tax=Kribbella jejuensis TaxID=236068 RepID=A0A542DAS7_9ACTN|nr:hypothetical protein [Kribbella jejuensis]TQJ00179.1 hypothetical protein FB475_7172 [Kribbella jejuensis]
MTTVPPERAAGEQIALLRSVGYAAFGRHERDLDVLDLVFDSLIDTPGAAGVRRLRFAGHGVTLDVQRTPEGVELRVSPAAPVVVESRGDEANRLVSFLLRWPGGTQRPVRTAWIIL